MSLCVCVCVYAYIWNCDMDIVLKLERKGLKERGLNERKKVLGRRSQEAKFYSGPSFSQNKSRYTPKKKKKKRCVVFQGNFGRELRWTQLKKQQ